MFLFILDLNFLDQKEVVQQIAGVNEKEAAECLDKANDDIIEAIVNAGPNKQDGPKPTPDEPLTYEDFKLGFEGSMDEIQRKNLSDEFMEKMYKKYLKDKEEEKSGTRYGDGRTAQYSWEESDDWGWLHYCPYLSAFRY